MKRIIYIILLISLVCCDKLFYEEEDTVQTIDSEAEIEAHLHGSYRALANIFRDFAYIRQILYSDDISWTVKSCYFILDTTAVFHCSSKCKRERIYFERRFRKQ